MLTLSNFYKSLSRLLAATILLFITCSTLKSVSASEDDKFSVLAPALAHVDIKNNHLAASSAEQTLVRKLESVIWMQVGDDIDGEFFCDASGTSAATNSAGSRVIVGAPLHDGGNNDAGHARVLEDQNGEWVQIGSDIEGTTVNEVSGQSVAMNNDGDKVIIGSPGKIGENSIPGIARIFKEENSEWVQLGSDLFGDAAGDLFGYSVDMNGEGTRVIIGGYNHDGGSGGLNSGHAKVFEEANGQWVQIGGDIGGEGRSDASGWSVAMNDEGNRVIIGAINNDGENGSNSGHARIFEEDSNGNWIQIGEDLDGEAVDNFFGHNVDINGVGDRVIIGAIGNSNPNGFVAGHARVFEESNGTWIQLGSDIDGESMTDLSGTQVSMNQEGSRVLITAIGNAGDNNGLGVGHARVYDYKSGDWDQVGNDINGETSFDAFGQSAAMNDEGSRIVIGTGANDGNGPNTGHVRVYEQTGTPMTAAPTLAPTPRPGTNCRSYPSKPSCRSNECVWFDSAQICLSCKNIPKRKICVFKGCTWRNGACS